MKRLTRKKGFTIIEVVLAIFLFSVGMISVIQIFPLNRRFLDQSTFQTQASFLAQEQMEKIRAESYADLTVGTYEPRAFLAGDVGAFATQYERSTTISLIDGTYAASATDVGLKKIVVTVYWSERNVARSYQLTTYANNI